MILSYTIFMLYLRKRDLNLESKNKVKTDKSFKTEVHYFISGGR